jgi:hypothetical protein
MTHHHIVSVAGLPTLGTENLRRQHQNENHNSEKAKSNHQHFERLRNQQIRQFQVQILGEIER